MLARLPSQIWYAALAGRAVVKDPFEAKERILERIAERREERAQQPRYVVDQHWERRLHELLGVPWPCNRTGSFTELWSDISRSLARQGLAVGRGAFGGWDDADPALARAAWCITVHGLPRYVLETGVARGITTRVILEALERSGAGHLYSIDIPPLLERHLQAEVAVAVPEDARLRWTLVRGSSRRRLRGVLAEIGEVDFFLHDSMHTKRNLLFELEHIWPVLAPGGIALVDDIERNTAFHSFADAVGDADCCIVARAEDGRALIGLIQKRRGGT